MNSYVSRMCVCAKKKHIDTEIHRFHIEILQELRFARYSKTAGNFSGVNLSRNISAVNFYTFTKVYG